MPLSIVAELVLELFGSLVLEGVLAGGRAATDATREALEERRRRRRERALACADLVVLAAWHDGVVTEAERAVLARACEDALAKVDVAVSVEELVDRWGGERLTFTDERAFDARVRSLGAVLERPDVRWVLRSVARLAEADARPHGGLRDRAESARRDTARRFRELLQ